MSLGVKRTAVYGAFVTVALGIALLLVDRTAFLVINRVEEVLQPCQHGGTFNARLQRCECLGPWAGTYCSDCMCENGGFCDTLRISVATPGTLWGCRCPSPPSKFVGLLCEQCNANLTDEGECLGECRDGFYGPDCATRCAETPDLTMVLTEAAYEEELQALEYGSLNVCSGHGTCRNVTGDCDCEPLWFPSPDGRSSCARTCPFFEGKRCAGHGQCQFRETSNLVTCVCEEGWLTSDCSVPCPGVEEEWIGKPCSGRGTCKLASPSRAECECGQLFKGDACEYRCPTGVLSDSSEACSGRGTCVLNVTDTYTRAECQCDAPYEGPGCGCEARSTCSGKGTCTPEGLCACDPNFMGARCSKCIPKHFGSDCDLLCESHPTKSDGYVDGEDIHCNGRGVCGVKGLGLGPEESVFCAACQPGYSTDTHCANCSEYFYPKLGPLQSAFDEVQQFPATATLRDVFLGVTRDMLPDKACHTFANRASCNHAGDPAELFGLTGDTLTPPCLCDAGNDRADPFSFCTTCLPAFYPDDMQSPDACSRRCVDDTMSVPETVDGVLTLRCLNGGVCAPDGLRCECPEGNSGRDCGVTCGLDGAEGGAAPCSGHGTCVTHTLQAFLEVEIGQRAPTNFSRCECAPGNAVSEAEKLAIFRGEEPALEGDGAQTKYDFYGMTCQHSCLPAPWKGGQECNGEDCRVLPIRNDRGDPILKCVVDSDCGVYRNGRLEFENKDTLTFDEQMLRNTLSLETRWSPTMGPFCHVPNVPPILATARMQCRERATQDSVDPDVDAQCMTYANKYDCLVRGAGACEYVDVCQRALDEFDVWSYCYEILRTEEPAVLRQKACAESCDYTALRGVQWHDQCNRFRARTPAAFAVCGNDLDDLCPSANATVVKCAATLPAASAPALDAVDTSAYCWEVSGQYGTAKFPFGFVPLLDTPVARQLQSEFDATLLEVGKRHPCLNNVNVTQDRCAALPQVDTSAAPVLFRCKPDDGTVSVGTLSASRIDGQLCTPLPSVRDLNPFTLRCFGEPNVPLEDVSYQEAVTLALARDCALLPTSELAASAVRADFAESLNTCRRVLDAQDPTPCVRVCGDDMCRDLGLTATGKRVFECQPRDSQVFVSVDDEGKCNRCSAGALCSVTGNAGGSQYRCVLDDAELIRKDTPSTFAPCRDGLLLHADTANGVVQTLGVQGLYPVYRDPAGGNDTVWYPPGAPKHLGTAGLRVEFDVVLDAAKRASVVVEGELGPICSVLFFYNGGFGVDLNLPRSDLDACPIGQEDRCHVTVELGRTYRVVVVSRAEPDGNTTLVMTVDGMTLERPMPTTAGPFEAVRVLGTSISVRDVWVFALPDTNCAELHRKLGRAVTFAASVLPTTNVSDRPALGSPSMRFCADAEAAFYPPIAAACGAESASILREAAFDSPWTPYCKYFAEFLPSLTPDLCDNVTAPLNDVVSCQSVLGHFADVECARNASEFDWDNDYCATLESARVPASLEQAGCSADCLKAVASVDTDTFCDDRDPYWDRDDGSPKSFLPSDVCADTGEWEKLDWVSHCTELAENKVEGWCSAAVCSCSQQSWLGGEACELACPLGPDYSVCSEASFGGVCTYKKSMSAAADAFYEDPFRNKISNQELFEIQGTCLCRHRDAMHEEGCKVECADEGEQACNPREYEAADGKKYQISSCDPGGSGVCRCNTPLTRQTLVNVTSWRGDTAEVLQFEFGDGGSTTGPYADTNAFRLAAQQGKRQLMVEYFGVDEAVYELQGTLDFETNPGKYSCADNRIYGNHTCTFHDVLIAQSLFGTSSFFGASCSRTCPGVDTGESFVPTPSCDGNASTQVGVDQLSLEGCGTECLSDHRCNFLEHVTNTSLCRLYSDCVPLGTVTPGVVWQKRAQTGPPRLTACSGRGSCGATGQCVCDVAKVLSLTVPLTGEKRIIASNKRGSLSGVPITTLDTTGFRGDDCSKVCPGFDLEAQDMSTVCSGHGICTRDARCQCDVNWVGVNCELRCPVKDVSVTDDQTVCAGHGTCSEARVEAGIDVTEEDSQRYYMVSEAYRRWYNLCPENTPLDYFVMPVGDLFNGTVRSEDIRGGVNCERVPQQQDDPTLPFVQRPEIVMDGLRDWVALDSEHDLAGETRFTVLGVADVSDPTLDRQGMFRRHFYTASHAVLEQTMFVQDFARVALYKSSAEVTSAENVGSETASTATFFDRLHGYSCGGTEIAYYPEEPTAGDCAKRCVEVAACQCFDYTEYYHSTFAGRCRLVKLGPLVAYPVERAVQVGNNPGLLERSTTTGKRVHFDEFLDSYVTLSDTRSCGAPTTSLGANVNDLNDCAAACARTTCTFFSYDPFRLRCLHVRTATAGCEEGFVDSAAGFYVVSRSNTGAPAPVAYTRTASARIFPVNNTRGTFAGAYVGRARPEYTTSIATCDCLSSAAWGFWAGFRCQTCQKFYGTKTCSKRCPGVVADEACYGQGSCLWGSKDAEGEVWYQSVCLCGSPPAPYSEDLSASGAWDVVTKDLNVVATYVGTAGAREPYEQPENYHFSSSSCGSCEENFGGLNCASTCSFCLFGGSCVFLPNSVSVSVPCQCVQKQLDPYSGCCPTGFFMLENLVYNDVAVLTTLLRRDRLNPSTRPDQGNPLPQTFYDLAVFPGIETSAMPARRWCAPMPGVYEDSWMKDDPTSLACAGVGFASDRGTRRVTLGASPPKFVPQTCKQMDVQGVKEGWTSVPHTVWYNYPNKAFLSDPLNITSSARKYVGPGGQALNSAEACRGLCGSDDCTGVTVKRTGGTEGVTCYLSSSNFVGNPQLDRSVGSFESFRKQNLAGVCMYPSSGVKCVLGTTAYGTLPLCLELRLTDSTSGVAGQLVAAEAALRATEDNAAKGVLYPSWLNASTLFNQSIANAKQPYLDARVRLSACGEHLNATYCDGGWATYLPNVQPAWNDYVLWQGYAVTYPVETGTQYDQRRKSSYTILSASTDRCVGEYRLLSSFECYEASLAFNVQGPGPRSMSLLFVGGCSQFDGGRFFWRDPSITPTSYDPKYVPVCAKLDKALGTQCQRCDGALADHSFYPQCSGSAVCVKSVVHHGIPGCVGSIRNYYYCVPAHLSTLSAAGVRTTFNEKKAALVHATADGVQRIDTQYLQPLTECHNTLNCTGVGADVQTLAQVYAVAKTAFDAAPAGEMCAPGVYCNATDVEAARAAVEALQVPLKLLGTSPTFGNLGTECLVRDTPQEPFRVGTGMECLELSDTGETDVYLDTPTPQTYAPTADAVVFGAHTTDNEFMVSVGTVPPLLGAMRPENPCATLSTPDMFWGGGEFTDSKGNTLRDRTKCQSAVDPTLQCDIREYQEPCVNVKMSGRAAEHLHSAMSEHAVLPHQLTLKGVGDVETSVFEADFQYRVAETRMAVATYSEATVAKVQLQIKVEEEEYVYYRNVMNQQQAAADEAKGLYQRAEQAKTDCNCFTVTQNVLCKVCKLWGMGGGFTCSTYINDLIHPSWARGCEAIHTFSVEQELEKMVRSNMVQWAKHRRDLALSASSSLNSILVSAAGSSGNKDLCTTANPCDVCEGHCTADDTCRGELVCKSTHSVCGGTPTSGDMYCVPPDAWTAEGTKLYLAGSVTAAGTLSTWVLRVQANRVVGSHLRADHAYVYNAPALSESCDASHPCKNFYRPLCKDGTCIALPPDTGTTRNFGVYNYEAAYIAGVPTSTSFVVGITDACSVVPTTYGMLYGTPKQILMCAPLVDLNNGNVWTATDFGYGITTHLQPYRSGIPVRDSLNSVASLFFASYTPPVCLWFQAGFYWVLEQNADVYYFAQGDPTAAPTLLTKKISGTRRLFISSGMFGYAALAAAAEAARVRAEEYRTNALNTLTDRKNAAEIAATNDATAASGGWNAAAAGKITCPSSKPLTINDLPTFDGDYKSGGTHTIEDLQRETLHEIRLHAARSQPSNDIDHDWGANVDDEMTGMLFVEGVGGDIVVYSHLPFVSAEKHPRSVSVKTNEECGMKCETTPGCTGFLFQGGGSGSAHNFCWLFTFDPSSTTCEIFDAVDTSSFPEVFTGICTSDCSGDDLHPHPTSVICAAGLRCFQRDKNKHQTPGCQMPSNLYTTYDVCYDPNAANVGVAAIRTPNACGLCKSRGLLPVVDVNRITVQYAGSQMKDDKVYFSECWTNAYPDTSVGVTQQRCRLFPEGTSWSAGRSDFTTFNRCPPTRAGVHTKFYSGTQHVGVKFSSDPLHKPTVLHGHPDILTYTECQTACVNAHGCVGWQYDEKTLDDMFTLLLAETSEQYTSRKQSSFVVMSSHTQTCTATYRPLGVVECGEAGVALGYGVEGGLPGGEMRGSSRADIPAGCTLYGAGTSSARVFWRDPQLAHGAPKSSHLPVCVRLDQGLGSHCQQCDPTSPYEQCTGSNVCFTSTTVNTVPGCLSDVSGLSYCVPKHLLEHNCSLFYGETPDIEPATTLQVFDGAHRIGFVERDYTPKTALMDDGEDHPACACYDENDFSYNCACQADNTAPFQNTISNDKFGCSGHGQCSSLEYACVCDPGYSWAWQDAIPADGLPAGFTCVACPAGTYRDATVPTCTVCPYGTYQPDVNASACHLCPPIVDDIVTITSCTSDSEYSSAFRCRNAYVGGSTNSWAILGTDAGGPGFDGDNEGWAQFEFGQDETILGFFFRQRVGIGDRVTSARFSFSDETFEDKTFDPTQTSVTVLFDAPHSTRYVRFKILTAYSDIYNPGIGHIEFARTLARKRTLITGSVTVDDCI